jgi:hypothetical protein
MLDRALVSTLLVVIAACSTSRARTASPDDGRATAAPIARVPVGNPGEHRTIRITGFDCEKRESFPRSPAQKGLIAPANGIRSWRGGGPAGANWNVEDLRCLVSASIPCERGRIELVLRVGQSLVADKRIEVTSSSIAIDIPVSSKDWKAHVDEASKRVMAGVPFQTAIFRALVALDCASPSPLSLKNSGYKTVTDEDSFVAAFASGE